MDVFQRILLEAQPNTSGSKEKKLTPTSTRSTHIIQKIFPHPLVNVSCAPHQVHHHNHFQTMSTHMSHDDSRVKKLFEVVAILQAQNPEQEHINEEQHFRTQILETREKQLQEQLNDMQRFAQVIEATKTLMKDFYHSQKRSRWWNHPHVTRCPVSCQHL